MNRYMISIPLELAERLATPRNTSEGWSVAADAATELRGLLVAKESLKFENQRITPVRYKCLACGDYHEGSGNLPCPKMSPMSAAEPLHPHNDGLDEYRQPVHVGELNAAQRLALARGELK